MKHIYSHTRNIGLKTLFSIILIFIGIEGWGQSYNDGYPAVSDIAETTATVNVQFNTSGYYVDLVILPSTTSAPSVQEVIDWSYDGNGGALTDGTWNEFTISGRNATTKTFTFSAYNLTKGTDYIAYFVASTDWTTNTSIEQTEPTQVTFTTESGITPTFDPTSGTTDVSTTPTLTANFGEGTSVTLTNYQTVLIWNLDTYSAEKTFTTGNSSEISIAHDSIFTIDLSSDTLDENTNYAVYIPNSSVISVDGTYYNDLQDTTTWYFTTTSYAPTTTFSPTDGATNISIESNIVATYDRAIYDSENTLITDSDLSGLITVSGTVSGTIAYTATISDNSVITIVPTANLSSSEDVTVTILPVYNAQGVVQDASQTCTFTTDATYTWTGGGSSTTFSDDTNWDGSITGETEAFSIIIPGSLSYYPELTTDKALNHITIDAGGSLTINDNVTLTVNNSLVLKSSIDESLGNANLYNNGGTIRSTSATVRIQQAVAGDYVGMYISSPVEGATATNTGIAGLFTRNVQQASWSQISSTTTMTPGIGYLSYSAAGDTINFTGTINSGNYGTFTTYRTTSPNNYGWNLTGNPFPCSIDWEGITTTNMDDEFYIMQNNTESYGTYNGNDGVDPDYANVDESNPSHIPSCHSFWTQVTLGQTSGTISIPSSAQVNTHYTYLKSTKATTSTTEKIRFAGLNSANTSDEVLISFRSSASDDDDSYDSEKRLSDNSGLLQIFTVRSSTKYIIDSYNNYDEGKAIVLGYKTGTAGTYRIAFTEWVNPTDGTTVTLEDTVNGTTTTMNVDDEYSFTTSAQTNTSRFIIHITGSSTTTSTNSATEIDNTINSAINVYSSKESIYISVPELTQPKYEIFSIDGKLLTSGILNSNSINKIESNHDGILIVKVTSNEQTYTQKVLVK